MKKSDYAKTHGLKVRKATKDDRKYLPENDKDRKFEYVVLSTKTQTLWTSPKGTLNDLKYIVKQESKPKNTKKTGEKRSTTASKSKKR